jgi:hypothetical protein
MEKEKQEKRLLGAQEILFYAMNEASPKHFLIAAEVEGNTEKSAWRNAAALLQQIHPMLSMSITAADGDLIFTRSDQTPMLVEIVSLQESFDLTSALEEELEKGFRSDQGPLARIKLFHSSQKSVIIIAAHHSISDALSSVNLINDLLGLLAGKTVRDLAVQPSVDEFLEFSNHGLAAKINLQLKPGTPLPHEFTKQHPPAKVDLLQFSSELTSLLAATAKKQQTTVHGALQAAAALALQQLEFTVPRPAYIMSPFSVRKEMNVGTDFGLFIDTKIVAVGTDEKEGFWNIARAANIALADVHTPEFQKASAEQLRGLISYSDDLIQFIKDNFNFDIMLSNLGRLSLDQSTDALKVNFVAGPFIISGFNHTQAIGATTVNGKLLLTSSSRYPVNGLLKAIESNIREACSA